MKTTRCFAAVAVLFAGCAYSQTEVVPADAPAAADDPALDPFYDPLTAYGDWWWNERYGWVYSPHVDVGWRPYTVGSWIWSDDYGWTWVSTEPFGWACFHYGRFVWLDDAGWVWVPGRVWGPAWVAWRTGPHHVGWAPLPPGGYVDVDVAYGPWGWVFVDETMFLAPSIVVVAVPAASAPRVFHETRVIHHPRRDDDRPRNVDVDKREVERAIGRPIPSHHVVARVRDDATASSDDVVLRRAPDVEVPNRRAADLPGVRGRFGPGRTTIERTLPAPSDDDVDRGFDAQRNRVTPEDQPQLDKDRAREKAAAKQKRPVPRKTPAPIKAAPPAVKPAPPPKRG